MGSTLACFGWAFDSFWAYVIFFCGSASRDFYAEFIASHDEFIIFNFWKTTDNTTRASKFVLVHGRVPIDSIPSSTTLASPLSIIADATTMENAKKTLPNPPSIVEDVAGSVDQVSLNPRVFPNDGSYVICEYVMGPNIDEGVYDQAHATQG